MYLKKPFTDMSAWIDLLLQAAFKTTFVYVRGIKVKVERGQLATSYDTLAKRWRWSKPTVKRYLARLERKQKLLLQKSNVTTLISICNYATYQCNVTANVTADVTADRHTKEESKESYLRTLTSSLSKDKSLDCVFCTTHAHKDKPKNETAESEDKHKDQQIDYDGLKRFFNESIEKANSTIKPISRMTDKRKHLVNARCKEYGKEAIMAVIKKAVKSEFLNGKNNRAWIANFDWLFDVNKFPKVFEGIYDFEVKTEAQIEQDKPRRLSYDEERMLRMDEAFKLIQ